MMATDDDLAAGLELKDQGMARALEAAAAWREEAAEAITYLARRGDPFTCDDLIELIGLPHESAQNRNGAVGAAINAAARSGQIHRVGYEKTARKTSHARPVAVWKGTTL